MFLVEIGVELKLELSGQMSGSRRAAAKSRVSRKAPIVTAERGFQSSPGVTMNLFIPEPISLRRSSAHNGGDSVDRHPFDTLATPIHSTESWLSGQEISMCCV